MTAIQDVPLEDDFGRTDSLADYAGQVLLIVNVASKCGLTPQYEGLEALYEKYKDEGFAVLGFPANDFAAQEPGTNEEIASFCTHQFRRSISRCSPRSASARTSTRFTPNW
jgi:glutathione peroxidase